MGPPYVRRATVLRVVDGDTVECRVSPGWGVSLLADVRLPHVNTPEPDEPGGPEATEFVHELLDEHGRDVYVVSDSYMPERSFARYLAAVVLADGTDLGRRLVEAGHAEWAG